MKEFSRPPDVNDAQWQAIVHASGHLLIVAGPGTGKTHTLTCRIAHLAEKIKSSSRILAVTFTNKAAQEMLLRLNKRLPKLSDLTFVGTFHSFCAQILREYVADTDLPKDWRIAAEEEISKTIQEAAPQAGSSERKNILDTISYWKSVGYTEQFPEMVIRYNKRLREKKNLDFDDLLLETIKLFNLKKSLLTKIQHIYRHLCVDEYQDINPAQYILLKLLVGKEGQLTAIGDPQQSIYGFRGSDARFFENFRQDFPKAAVIYLSQNYRSTRKILTASAQVIAKNTKGHAPELTTSLIELGRLTIHEAATDKAEAEYVVHQIERLVGGTSMFSHDSRRVGPEDEGERGEPSEHGFAEIAVLFRLNSQGRLLKEAFDRSGIPYALASAQKEKESEDDDVCPRRFEDFRFEPEKVSLMTLHASKGLEFPVVFIVGCEETLLPLNIVGLKSDQEEERRLFYVGMTRAKKRLYLIRARTRRLFGQDLHNDPSPFLADIEEELKSYELSLPKSPPRKKEEEQMSLF